MDVHGTRTRRQMIGSAIGLVGAGIVGLSRLDRGVLRATGADLNASARATRPAIRVSAPTTTTTTATTTTTTTVPPGTGELAFPVDPTGGLIVLNNFGDDSVALGDCAHRGIDIFPRHGESGRPLLACVDGMVRDLRFAATSGAQGNAVILEDEAGDIYRYHHLEDFAEGIEAGIPVVRGQRVGFMGSSGNTESPHLHFEVRRGGTAGPAVDPVPLLPFPIPDVELTDPMRCDD